MKVLIPYATNENKDDIKKIEEILLQRVRNNSSLGIVNVNGYIMTYSFKLKLDDKTYYINMELANGRYISRIKDLSKAYMSDEFGKDKEKNKLQLYCEMVKRASFDYKVIIYDNDINYIYIFNEKYKPLFDDINNNNNTYADLD